MSCLSWIALLLLAGLLALVALGSYALGAVVQADEDRDRI